MNKKHPFNLETLLQEDAETAAEADVLLPLLTQLKEADRAQPTAVDTIQLINTLLPELPTQPAWQRWQTAVTNSWIWLLLQSQMRIVRLEIWAASAIVMALGVFISIILRSDNIMIGLPLILTAPLVAAVGIAALYGSSDRVWELEMTTAVHPRLLLLARLLLVFGFDLILALLSSLALSFILPDVALWSLITTWLAPMTFLAALAFLITILSGASEIGIMVSMALWVLQIVRHSTNMRLFAAYIPDMLAPYNHTWLWLLALLLGVYAFWLGGREERWVNQ
jgi:hypothetical protein